MNKLLLTLALALALPSAAHAGYTRICNPEGTCVIGTAPVAGSPSGAVSTRATLPDGTYNLVGDTTAQTLTNKTLNGATLGAVTITNPAAFRASLGATTLGDGLFTAATAQAGLNLLLPAQAGQGGKVLATDGSNTSWTTVSGGSGGTLTSVDVAGPGLTSTGPVTGAGGTVTLNVSNPATLRAALGSGATGEQLFQAATAASARGTLGATATGESIFTAASAAAVRTLLGLGTAAVQNVTAFLQAANNLSDVTDKATARQNLGTAGTAGFYQIVGQRTGLNGLGGSYTGPGMVQRMQHLLPVGAQDVSLVFAGFYMKNVGGVVTENPMAVGDTGTVYRATGATVVAGGSNLQLGDRLTLAVNANDLSPVLTVGAVSAGAATRLDVGYGGYFAMGLPSSGLALASVVHADGSASTGTGLTVTLTLEPYATGFNAGIEQVYGTQTAYSSSNLTGVRKAWTTVGIAGRKNHVFLKSGDIAVTDAVPVNLPAGSVIGTRLALGGKWWVGRYLSTGSGGLSEYQGYLQYTDYSAGGTMPNTGSEAMGMQPLAIMGRVAKPTPAFVIIGDSMCRGYIGTAGYDTGDAANRRGWCERALAAWPHAPMATDGDRLDNWLGAGADMRWRALAYLHPSDVLDELVVNDMAALGTSAATLKAQKVAFWKMLRGIGVQRVWCSTSTPVTTSTDGWTTLANQTNTVPAIQTFNADLRINYAAMGCDVLIDHGADVESTVGSGKWPVGCTDDGIHLKQACVATVATNRAPTFNAATLN